jgi:hypothetical protein
VNAYLGFVDGVDRLLFDLDAVRRVVGQTKRILAGKNIRPDAIVDLRSAARGESEFGEVNDVTARSLTHCHQPGAGRG